MTTLGRWVIEADFAGVRQFRACDKRQIDSHFFDPVGNKIDGMSEIPKVEVIMNNILCNLNRTRKPLDRIFDLPEDVSETEFGHLVQHRLFLENELNEFMENPVQFCVNFGVMPNPDNPTQGWTSTVYNDPELEYGQHTEKELFILGMGPFQINQSPKYITDLRQNEVDEQVRMQDDPTYSYKQYDTDCCSLPVNTPVFYIDMKEVPGNWNETYFGPWCPRRCILLQIPSLHSPQKKHKVILFYLPTSVPLPQGFINRFQFRHGFLERLLGYACISCKSGLRTLGCCSHVMAACVLIGMYAKDEELFNSKYKSAHYFDVSKPACLNISLMT